MADDPTKPAIPLAEAVTIGSVSSGIVQKLVIKVTLLGGLNREVKTETASYNAVRVQALIVWLTHVNR